MVNKSTCEHIQVSFIIRKMQSKTTIGYCLTSAQMATQRNTNKNPLTISRGGKDNGNPHPLLVGM